MFQVASHPAAFPHHHAPRRHREHSSSDAGPMQLPRNLAKPPFTDISRDALAAAAPDLAAAAVPAEFIRHGLRAKAPQMQAGIAALAPSHLPQSLPRSHLPAALTIPLRASSSQSHPSYPTHALAVHATSSSKSSAPAPGESASLFPVHAVVLAAHCAKLPRLPPAAPPSRSGSALTLPVLPLALPSPHAFAILHPWMYTHRLDAALGALLPLPPAFLDGLAAAHSSSSHSHSSHSHSHSRSSSHASQPQPPTPPQTLLLAALASPPTLHALAAHLCATAGANLSALLAHAGHVKELWQDLVALGVYDPALWDALDLAWEVVLGALNLAAAGR
ncbi:hypothetical protein B0H11DRAFT_2153557 [Mycena galericulata]|nr:hypothetical protein B0H11DRAFT_2153557 [Mycena galericulata]